MPDVSIMAQVSKGSLLCDLLDASGKLNKLMRKQENISTTFQEKYAALHYHFLQE